MSPDTVVPEPGSGRGFNRYRYARNNPLKYVDPTGHFSEDEITEFFDKEGWEEVLEMFQEGGEFEGRSGWLATLMKAETGDTVSIQWDVPNNDSFTGEFQFDLDGNLIIVGPDSYINQRSAASYGKEFELTHNEPLIGERQSMWSASAADRDLRWVGSKTDFVGKFGPTPGKSVSPVGKGLLVGFSTIAAGELLHLGGEAMVLAPEAGPIGGPLLFGTGAVLWSAAAGLTILAANTAAAP